MKLLIITFMKKTAKVATFIVLLLSYLSLGYFLNSFASEKPTIIFFYGKGCPHCAKVEDFIKKNKLENMFNIEGKEIYFNQKNRQEFVATCQKYHINLNQAGVPMVKIGDQCLIGDKQIIKFLKKKMGNFSLSNKKQNQNKSKRLTHLTLPLVLMAAGVDAVNPCAFAVLILLMMTILASKDRKKALVAGLCFSGSIYISYFLMGLGIYKAFSTAALSFWLTKIIGLLAVTLGILNLKDFFFYGGLGFIMEVPRTWRPRLKSIISSVASPLGAFFIGFLISLFLLPCTSGPYIVILGMLSHRQNFGAALGWLGLYNAVFILPMILISLGVYKGLDPKKLEKKRQKGLRILHLIAGLLMLGMGIIIL